MNRAKSALINEQLIRLIIAKQDGEDIGDWSQHAARLGLTHAAILQRVARLKTEMRNLVTLE